MLGDAGATPRRPAARLKVNVNLNDVLIAALRSGDIELSINALPATLPDELQAMALLTDDLCMVVRDGHPLLARRRLCLADLADARWMLPGTEVAARRAVEARLIEAGLAPPRVVVEVSTTATQLVDILRASDLVSLVSESALADESHRGLSVLPMADARFTRRIGMLTRRDARLSPLAQRFVEILGELPR